MPTTFNVFFLGTLTDIDTTEGNTNAEGAAALNGLTFGGVSNALLNNAQVFSPGTTGFAGGTTTAYDQDNAPAENFRINGGPNQTFDSTAVYNATITYTNGTTAAITAVLFQDTAGRTYWAPEFAAGADQTAMEANSIRSLTLNSVSSLTFSGLTGNRQTWNIVTCYLRGTHIRTPDGECRIEDLQAGDLILTRDRGPQPIRWIGSRTALARGNLAPIRIAKGALGPGKPSRDLYVSRQHRMLLQSKIAERMTGAAEVFVPAVKLLNMPGIEAASGPVPITYFHILTDRHDIIFAEGAPSETLMTGPQARKALSAEALAELDALFPGVIAADLTPARPIFPSARVPQLLERHQKNHVALVH
ncbi:MAG: Hint domain-containing protein [Paracoccaceae bacterium]